ncbi:gene transfer agent (GTA) like protein [Nitrobacter hamburgensis X14]|uniref:Gene transfer agent (GTA) like protein n=1 Tax=Nitrobacter hamburgensis (strain DSM 10229 / NCIMB 13809 / X14) TaxID=323097 RepID=Q1QNF3_NITHX|nr:phage tail tape measure protein [Nitrobacter hamburgensis]ABE62244.1 gene transfer agent (GTA) like protein [Nitrobacter hamburgensis X14]
MTDDTSLQDASSTLDSITAKTQALTISAGGFARAMTQAFSSSINGGKQFDDVLKTLALRVSSLAVTAAFKPLTASLTSGISSLFSGLTGSAGAAAGVQANALGAIKPFASGGVIGTPSYFPMMDGGVGLAGEAGPEAIMPLVRGADGRLGVSGNGGGNSITVQIATPDLDSFRRSESYVTGQIARAVARGQRSL